MLQVWPYLPAFAYCSGEAGLETRGYDRASYGNLVLYRTRCDIGDGLAIMLGYCIPSIPSIEQLCLKHFGV